MSEVKAYIERQPPHAKAALKKIRALVRRLAPASEERMSYGMPAHFQRGVLLNYGAFAKHVGVFPPVRDNPALQRALAKYSGPKGNLKFPYHEQLPVRLIERLVRHRLRLQVQRESVGRGRRGRPLHGSAGAPGLSRSVQWARDTSASRRAATAATAPAARAR